MNRKVGVTLAAVALASINMMGGVAPAHASSSASGCTIAVNNPHTSSGAGGVIVKARVTCSSTRTVAFYGSLGSGPYIGPHMTRATNSETRTVAGGTTATFYVPAADKPGVPCSSSLYYSAYGKITVNGVQASASSMHVKAC